MTQSPAMTRTFFYALLTDLKGRGSLAGRRPSRKTDRRQSKKISPRRNFPPKAVSFFTATAILKIKVLIVNRVWPLFWGTTRGEIYDPNFFEISNPNFYGTPW